MGNETHLVPLGGTPRAQRSRQPYIGKGGRHTRRRALGPNPWSQSARRAQALGLALGRCWCRWRDGGRWHSSFAGAVKAWSDVSSEAAAKHCSTSPIVCPPGVDSSNIQRNQTGGQAMDIIGVSFTAVGGAALVAGITWHYLEPTKPLPTGTARFSVAPWVGRGGGVLLQGSF